VPGHAVWGVDGMEDETARRQCRTWRAGATPSSIATALRAGSAAARGRDGRFICHGRVAQSRPWQKRGSGGGEGASWEGEESALPWQKEQARCHLLLPLQRAVHSLGFLGVDRRKTPASLGIRAGGVRSPESGTHRVTCRSCDGSDGCGVPQNGNPGSDHCEAARLGEG
jgi:hypothetical protein